MLAPLMKTFNIQPHERLISGLAKDMPTKKFEATCEPIVFDILANYEYFVSIEQGPSFTGTPFDFFGFRDSTPYIVEFKGSLRKFNFPGEIQRRRMKELLAAVPELHIALLQVKVCEGIYRMSYDDEVRLFFSVRKAPMGPIADWVRARL